MRITAGQWKNHRLTPPKGTATRPTTEKLRQAVFNSLQGEIEGSLFLDLFAGSGAMGLEALSRGAQAATFVENNSLALRAIRANISKLGATKQTRLLPLHVTKALKLLANEKQRFTLIYADPPYRQYDCAQLITDLDNLRLLSQGGTLIIETTSERLNLSLDSLHLTRHRSLKETYLHYYCVSSSFNRLT